METAKVDIRKLQVLNDRINQCIDALNQVRLSVHGLAPAQQTAGINPAAGLSHTSFGASPFGAGLPNPLSLYGQPAIGVPYPGVGINPFASGIAHTTGFGQQGAGAFGMTGPFGAFGPETYETSLRPVWADPLLTARIQQTFPYAQFPMPPVVTIY